jgi:two-component system, cell cycle sensor histidine kinase and response regulator CckA
MTSQRPLDQRAALQVHEGLALAAASGLFLLAGAIVDDGIGRTVLLSIGGTLVALAVFVAVGRIRQRHGQLSAERQLDELVGQDPAPAFCTDARGAIGYRNAAARARFGGGDSAPLIDALGDLFAEPSTVLARMRKTALAAGAAREDVLTRRGHARLTVHRVAGDRCLWRLEELSDPLIAARGGDGLSLPMLVASRSGTVLFLNDTLRRLLGRTVATLDRIFIDMPLRPGEEMEIAAAEGRRRVLVAEIEADGGRREIYLMPTAPDELRPSGDPATFENLPVALLRLSGDGEIGAANRMAREVLTPDPAQKLPAGARFSDLVEGLGRPVADWLADGLAGRTVNRPEVARVRRDDRETFVQIILRRVVEHGRPRLVAVLIDATELKTLEAKFAQSQKMQAIGQLAGGVAHDFNNLLTAISGHCDLLLLRHDTSDGDYADLMQIHQNANRAAALVRQLLAFSRKQTLMPEAVDLRDSLSDLTHLLNRLVGERVRLTFTNDPDLHPIRADRRQLEQVIMNLVVNARDAMPDGGEIRIQTSNLVLKKPQSRDRATMPPGDYVLVQVQDTGTGIPPDRVGKIFEPFFTTKRSGEGTGLGLSTVYGIVKQSGGYIFVDSTVGEGTTFTLYFPACLQPLVVDTHPARPAIPVVPTQAAHRSLFGAASEEAVAPDRAIRSERTGEGVVLIVEDEAPVRAFASRALRLKGYVVLEAENAEDALATLADPAVSVDVFVTDVIMPGMDGPTWVREAIKTRPDVKVIFMSGYAEDNMAEAQARIPNSVFLPKPFSLGELAATVNAQMR